MWVNPPRPLHNLTSLFRIPPVWLRSHRAVYDRQILDEHPDATGGCQQHSSLTDFLRWPSVQTNSRVRRYLPALGRAPWDLGRSRLPLRFLAGRGDDHGALGGTLGAAQDADEAAHAGVAAAKPCSEISAWYMAMAFRSQLAACTMSSRTGSQRLADGARPGLAKSGGSMVTGAAEADFGGAGSGATGSHWPVLAASGSVGVVRKCLLALSSHVGLAAHPGGLLDPAQRPAQPTQASTCYLLDSLKTFTSAGNHTPCSSSTSCFCCSHWPVFRC